MSKYQGEPVAVKNVGTEDVPPFGVVLMRDADAVSDKNPEIETLVLSPLNNDQESEDGTFQSVFHYHSTLGFNCGAKLKKDGHGHAYFGFDGLIRAATETDDIALTDILVATTDSAKLRKLSRGTPGTPGDYSNIFGLFKPLKRLRDNLWVVSYIRAPMFACKAAEAASAGTPAVATIMQHGDLDSSTISVVLDTTSYISYFPEADYATDDKFTVALVAGALVSLSGSGSSGGGGGGETCSPCAGKMTAGLVDVDGKKLSGLLTITDAAFLSALGIDAPDIEWSGSQYAADSIDYTCPS